VSAYLQKSGCPHCARNFSLTLEDAVKVATSKGGRCLSTVYKNARTKLKWECNSGHQWEATIDSVGGGRGARGTWCPICSRTDVPLKYTYDDAIALAESRGGKFLSQEMKTVLSQYEWQCANGHKWRATFSSIYTGSWCPSCSRHLGERLTRIVFETLFEQKFPTSRPEWLRSHTGTRLSLDGYCKDIGLAFEHQGEQHYSEKNYFGNTVEEQEQIKVYDQLKQLLCKQNGVDLIIIPEVPRLTGLDILKDFVNKACSEVGKCPPNPYKTIRYEQAYIEDRRLHRLNETAVAKGGQLIEKTYFGMRHRYTWRCSEGQDVNQRII